MPANGEDKMQYEVCMIAVTLLVALSTLVVGAVTWIIEGYSYTIMMLLVCGGTVSILIIVGLIMSNVLSPRKPTAPESTLPLHDPPPDYRNTWRLQYINKSPAYLRDELELPQPVKCNSREQMCGAWKFTAEEVAVHGDNSSRAEFEQISEIPPTGQSSGRETASTGSHLSLKGPARHVRANTMLLDASHLLATSKNFSRRNTSEVADGMITISHSSHDDGLPSYEQAQLT